MVWDFAKVGKVGDGKGVFVVHGRDEEARNAMFTFLSSLGLHPLEWSELKVSTGEPNPYIGDIIDKAFASAQAIVVLMTPDDEGRIREEYVRGSDPESERILTPQARLNVIFESGMALGRCPERTIIVEWGKLRPFSDIAGRHVVRMDGTQSKWDELSALLSMVGCVTNQKPSPRKGSGGLRIVATGDVSPGSPTNRVVEKQELPREDRRESTEQRVVVRKSLSEIVSYLSSHTAFRAELLAKELYVGKWVEWEMVVDDVLGPYEGGHCVVLTLKPVHNPQIGSCAFARFREEAKDAVAHLDKGDRVKVVGQIQEANGSVVRLDPARLL